MNMKFGFSLPAIKGIQAKREYYVSMCPLKLIPKLFIFSDEEMAPELRAQRRINRTRIPTISNYITSNRGTYAFSAITASLDGDIEFEPISQKDDTRNLGILKLPLDMKFIINDGQHRRAAIEEAIREMPEIGEESISVVFFQDPGLKRCQQLFTDLNRNAIRPQKSISILYDHRDGLAILSKKLVGKNGVFEGIVELEKTNLAARSGRLFTLSAIYRATEELLHELDYKGDPFDLATDFWKNVKKQIKEWNQVQNKDVTAGEIRQDYIHSHAITIQAIGKLGNTLIKEHPKDWQKHLVGLKNIDWRRANEKLWEGRAMLAGRITKGVQNETLTTNIIKLKLKLALTPEELKVEKAFNKMKKK